MEWLSLLDEARDLDSMTLEILASEAFNSLIICIQSECEKYGIDYSIENLCGDNTYLMTIMNKLNDRYMEEEDAKEWQRQVEELNAKNEARYDALRKGE